MISRLRDAIFWTDSQTLNDYSGARSGSNDPGSPVLPSWNTSANA